MNKYISKVIVYVAFILLFVISQSACIKIYRQDLRQGNYVTQSKIDKLKVGMSKEEVKEIMGSPAVIPVMDTNRWDYYYSFLSGDRKIKENKSLSLYFINDELQYFNGDWNPLHLPRKIR